MYCQYTGSFKGLRSHANLPCLVNLALCWNCYGRTRRETCGSICKTFIQRRGHKASTVQTMANRYNTGKTKSNPRTSVGLRSANRIQRVVNTNKPNNSPDRGEQSPNGKTIGHRSLTGGPRSGYGPRSHPIRTRTYSQKRRLRFKTWRRGASISTGAAFVVFTVVVVGSPTGGLRSESVKAFDIMK